MGAQSLARCAAIAVALNLALPASSGAETRPDYGEDLVASLVGEPTTLDPIAATDHASLTVVELIFDPLYQSRDGAPRPHLAAALPLLSADGLEARIRLRSELRFHDGAVLTAGDVVASLDRARRAGVPGLGAIVRITADGDEVVLRLRRVDPDLARALSASATSITRGGKAPTTALAIGTGPFRLASLDRRHRVVVLEAFDQHFAGRSYLDGLRLRWFLRADAEPRAYESGASHMSLRGAIAFAGHQPRYRTRVADGPATVLLYVGFGDRHRAVTDNRDFRRALSAALGRDGFRHFGSGERIEPTLSPVPRSLGGPSTPARALESSLAAAKTALAAAARDVPALAGGRGLELRITVDRTRPDDKDVAGKIALALFRLGLGAKVVEVDAADLGRAKTDLFVGHLAARGREPESILAAAFAAGDDDFAIRRARAAAPDARALAAAFAERLPIVPLFHRSMRVHHRADVLGVDFTTAARIAFEDLFLFGEPPKN